MADRPDRNNRNRTPPVTPDPKRPGLFAFLEGLWASEPPEKIELRQATDPSATKFRLSVNTWPFKQNSKPLEREALVHLSNEILDKAQENCDEIGRKQKYGVLAKHYGKSDTYFAYYVLSLRPQQKPDDGMDDGSGSEDDAGNDKARRDSLLQYSLDHIKQADQNDQWRQDQFAKTMGDIIEMLITDRRDDRAHYLEMEKQRRENFVAMEEALSRKSERDNAAEMQKFKMLMMQKGFGFLTQMVPVALQKITGKQVIPTSQSPESLAIGGFLESLTEAQSVALFGHCEPGEKLPSKGGIFSPEQTRIFAGVASCELPATEIDKLFKGEHTVTGEQVVALQSQVTPDQWMPLMAFVMEKAKSLNLMATATAAADTTTPNP